MTDERFVELVAAGYTCRQVAAMMHRHHSAAQRRAERLGVRFSLAKPPRCRVCGETEPTKFGRQKERCLPCWREYHRERNRERRRQIIETLGGACAACGYNRYVAALDVHHVDPTRKHPSAHRLASLTWDRVTRELKHCILLCANCHRGLHHGEHAVDAKPSEILSSLSRVPHRFPVSDDLLLDPDPLEGSGFTKLTADQVLAIRALSLQGTPQQVIAAQFGIGQAYVSKLVLGQRWARGPWPAENAPVSTSEALDAA